MILGRGVGPEQEGTMVQQTSTGLRMRGGNSSLDSNRAGRSTGIPMEQGVMKGAHETVSSNVENRMSVKGGQEEGTVQNICTDDHREFLRKRKADLHFDSRALRGGKSNEKAHKMCKSNKEGERRNNSARKTR